MRRLIAFAGIAALTACHRTPVDLPGTDVACLSPHPPPTAGTVRLDGPGSFFGPTLHALHVNDSLIVSVDNRERWRGVIRSCVRAAPGLSIDLTRWQTAGDTLEPIALNRASPTVWLFQFASRRKKRD
jgi:hypothetical protein